MGCNETGELSDVDRLRFGSLSGFGMGLVSKCRLGVCSVLKMNIQDVCAVGCRGVIQGIGNYSAQYESLLD